MIAVPTNTVTYGNHTYSEYGHAPATRSIVVFATDEGIDAFEHPGFALSIAAGTIRGDGTTWDPVTAESADGRGLRRLPARRLYAFAWQDDHGEDAFYGH